MIFRRVVPALFAVSLVGCPSSKTSNITPTPVAENEVVNAAPGGSAAAAGVVLPGAEAHAALGQKVPEFALTDVDGKLVALSSFAGKTVVLEWFNPECPFIKVAHTHTLKEYGNDLGKKGVVILAINSNAAGKQGSELQANLAARDRFGIAYPILLDPTGAVGKAYGATNTPHMFVIDGKGTLVYEGAIDDTKGGDPDPGDNVTNYVEQALDAVTKNGAPATTHTKAWGCSVKYGS